MPLPTLLKTWQISANNVTPSQDEDTYYPAIMYALKVVLTGFASNPWTVVASSNSVTASAADNWASVADVVWGTGARSWLLLQNVDGRQILFNPEFSGTLQPEDMTITISLGGNFTGFTSTTVPPTASDQQTLQTGHATSWLADQITTPSQGVFHVWHSTDGKITRFIFLHTSVVRTFFSIEPIRNAATGHTDPVAFGWYGNVGGDVSTVTVGEDVGLFNTTHSGTSYRMHFTGEGNTGFNLVEKSEASQVDDISGELFMTEIGFTCKTVGARGWRGATTDLWWGPYQVAGVGDTFPVDANARQFICLGAYVLPWTGDSTVPVTI